MSYEVFEKYARQQHKPLRISCRTDQIYISSAALAFLGSPSHVILYVDKEAGKYAMGPSRDTGDNFKNSYLVTYQGIGRAQGSITVRQFLKQTSLLNSKWHVCQPIPGVDSILEWKHRDSVEQKRDNVHD